MSVVIMLLFGTCNSAEQVSGGHVTVVASHSGQRALVIMLLFRTCHSGQQVSGGHVTVSNRPLVAMLLWGLCLSG